MIPHINLLPESLLRRVSRTRILSGWTLATLAILTLIASNGFERWTEVRRLERTLSATRPDGDHAQSLLHLTRQTEQQITALKEEYTRLRHRNHPSELPRLVGWIATRCNACSSPVRLIRLHCTAPERADNEPSPPLRTTRITLFGQAESDVAVSEFVESLHGESAFSSVRLKRSAAAANSEVHREFEITCERSTL